ncbi:MAG: serine--tRNA ligase [Anaerolineae bacterium]|jgi:seryl-tRNA synthetase
MIDLAMIRDNTETVREAMRAVGALDAPIDEVLALDARRRELLVSVETLRAERNRVSKLIPKVKDQAERAQLVTEMRGVGQRIDALDAELGPLEAELQHALLQIPNMPDPAVPVGPDESANIVVRQEGVLPTYAFQPQAHWDLGPALDIIDFDRGVKISGSRFYLLKGQGARLQRALISYMLDLHTLKQDYVEVYPPYMVRRECLVGTAQLPKFADNLYMDQADDLWLVPTAEVPVTNMYRDEILDAAQLPIHHVAYTACFRREQMSAGRDTRGIKRGHQFDKVELVKFVEPSQSAAELESLIADAEAVLRGLELPYRVIQMCTGDLSFSAAIKYDLEVWAAGCQEWLEVSSCSNFKDFQARRANIRYRSAGGRPEFVHTLNGSGLALPRTLIAVIENYQTADGHVTIPDALRPYMGGVSQI